ncbi:prenyltransferase, UbiA family [Clostridiales bacterium oral taxon 876 str. F0540]|nr:prenyltransferase, UbiA family [Clostridiales bacterium oral taxon 876 str. F0540]
MNIKSFLKFVEIQTKVASVIPFTFGTVLAFYRYSSFKLSNFLIMFVSLITFDMATTAINNYIDFKKANKKEGYGYEVHNVMGTGGISEKTAQKIIITLLSVATIFGLILTLRTSPVVLLIGMLCFAIGIFYTFGPIPISRMPLGEAFSGVTMGFGITFLAVFIHAYDKNIAFLSYTNNILGLGVNILEVLSIFLISLPLIGCIANIMLANNICDLEDDIENQRFTLPYYIGKNNALKLFAFLYYIGYIAIIASVVLKILPLSGLVMLITIIPVYKNIKAFQVNPSKAETFVLSVKNMVIVNMFNITVMAAITIINTLV